MRPLLLVVACFALPALAQDREPLDPRKNQKIERLKAEDSAVRIDELRVGGESQSVTVQPKDSALPAYEIQPSDGARTRPDTRGFSESKPVRVWNIFSF